MKLFPLLFVLAASGLAQARAADPQWIWFTKEAGDGEVRYFRKEFTLSSVPSEARLYASCDDEAIVFVNGKQAGESGAWEQPVVAKGVEKLLHEGANVIAIRGKNHSGAAAAVARLEIKMRDGSKQEIVSDDTWKAGESEAPNWNSAPFDASRWRKPVVIAKLGDQPWGDVFASGGGGGAPAGPGTPTEEIATLPDFNVELVLNAEKARHGSWVAMAKDDKGRLILGSQGGNKITRLTLKDGKVVNDEDLNLPFSEPMGMLWAFNSLYINGNGKATDGKNGHGIYRLQDTRGDGHFDKIEQLFAWPGGAGGEHGSHGLVIGPGNKIYVVSGNFTDLPKTLLPTSPLRDFADDLVLPRAEDGNGFGAGRKPPGGSILRMDADGKNAELFAVGERNTYDIAFNADGELFGFDSDMEWDWGTPWYRPIRIFHATSGADQGFREGTGKWPEYYADSLPAVVNIGLGSPTGVIFGYGAKFPAKYQNALYVLDWTYGRLIAAHLTPNGATYSATWENFVAPKSLHGNGRKWPLDLTAAIVGDDGSMYFTVGGRDTQASLYRVTYSGSESTAAAEAHEAPISQDRAIRRQLEAYHGKKDARVVAAAWPYLGNADRHIRYAARLAIESQPVEEWRERALAETKPAGALTALLALARLGPKETQPAIFGALQKIPFASLTEDQQLDMLRVVEVSVARQGAPESAPSIVADFDAAYPSPSISLNRELCQTLLAFKVPDAVAKTIKLLAAAKTQEEQLTYILHLRTIKAGWTPELRATYFGWWNHRPPASHPDYVLKWFDDAGRPYSDGSSFNNFLQNIHADAERTLTAQEIDQLQPVLAAYVPANARPPRKPVKQRGFVKVWEMADLEPLLGETSHGRNYENGRDAFAAGQCLLCHRFGDEGGAVGPDLTAIAARFSMRDILESIVDPSKVISEQYANEEFKLKNGDLAIGRVVGETNDKVTLRPSLLAPQMQEIKKSDIVSKSFSKVSPMPPALISTLTKEDVLDLLAYLASAGKKDAPAFSK